MNTFEMRSHNPEHFLDHHLQRAASSLYFFMKLLLSDFNYGHFASSLFQGLPVLV